MEKCMRTIEVVPNPYIALDKDGVPQGVVGAGMPGAFVGAQLDLELANKTGKNRFYFPANRDGSLTRKVHLTGSIAASVLAGELLAANKADALACGITDKEYLEPAKALDAEKAKAIAYYQSVHGKDAKVQDIPREPAMVDSDAAPAPHAVKQLTPTVKMTKSTEA
jgi:hypothetical protein